MVKETRDKSRQKVRRAINQLLMAADRSVKAAEATRQALEQLARLAPRETSEAGGCRDD